MIKPNSERYERDIVIASKGFREYDARWMYPDDLNLNGVRALGQGIATLMAQTNTPPKIIVGHDYRSYSAAIKHALIVGLMASGCEVLDIGLALSPVAYFSQFHLNCQSVAMVTASHNENGWTGVKMGTERPLTFGPQEMNRLKDIVLTKSYFDAPGGAYRYVPDIKKAYCDDLVKEGALQRKLKLVIACGNGTAGAYAPDIFRRLGCDVIEMDCDLDYTFPHYNPNPEDMNMLHKLAARVRESGADAGFAFDGDGDRCGVVDDKGEEIFADKIGVLLARDLSALYPGSGFIADVKSTGIFMTDQVLLKHGAKTEYWMTGHSYMKRRVHEANALAGFEKSGHFFFNAPIGRGYDDGILSAISVCRMLDRAVGVSLSHLKNSLPKTWMSPTMSPFCPDEIKYQLVGEITDIIKRMQSFGEKVLGQTIIDIVTVNGVRFTLQDGTWGLVRASSNKPSLVVVVESPVSDLKMHDMFDFIDNLLRQFKDVGDYDQRLTRAA